tara:strand:+ start:1679 stop:2104 length:426 start_codon:yes stop_codon:yes gene_type:complete
MRKIMNNILLLLAIFVFTGCSIADGKIYLGVSSTGTMDLEVEGLNLTCFFGVCSNSSGEYDEVDAGEVNYTYNTYAYDSSGNLIEDDPDTNEDESMTERSGSIIFTANSGSFPDDGEDKTCLLTIIGHSYGIGEITDLICE